MYLMNLFKIHQVYLVNITRIGWWIHGSATGMLAPESEMKRFGNIL